MSRMSLMTGISHQLFSLQVSRPLGNTDPGVASAFICFVEHHNAVPELAEAFAKAAQLARSAINSLAEAKMFEDIIGRGTNLNRALWAVYGGQWQGPERGGLELEPANENTPMVEETGSDGGWEVEQSEYTEQQS
jgi:hypothetical protein